MEHLKAQGHEVINIGTDDPESGDDYVVSGYIAAKMVADHRADGGVLICGTGLGIGLAANKVNGIRACVCSEPCTARLSKEHNNANMIAFGARIVGEEMAKCIVDAWLSATFQGGRHKRRVDMLTEIEQTGRLKAAENFLGR
jgi:ribose 5-phosphate isomerase B